jgi:hypothetical protein
MSPISSTIASKIIKTTLLSYLPILSIIIIFLTKLIRLNSVPPESLLSPINPLTVIHYNRFPFVPQSPSTTIAKTTTSSIRIAPPILQM